MDKKSIAQLSDILRDKLLDETKAKAAYYRILPDSIRNVDDDYLMIYDEQKL